MDLTKSAVQDRLAVLQGQYDEALQMCSTLDEKVNQAVKKRGQLTTDIKKLEGKIEELNRQLVEDFV